MSKPQAGTYVIYNRVLSPSGDRLAITFNGQGNTATVTPLSYGGLQKWVIVDFSDGRTQSVTPTTSSNLQAAWGNEGVSVLTAGGYVWTIRSSDTGYTIKDGGVTVNWGVDNATGGANARLSLYFLHVLSNAGHDGQVAIRGDTGNEKQRWILEKV